MSHDVDSRYFDPEDYQVAAKMGAFNKKKKELVEAFASIENHDLKVANMICIDCGYIFDVNDKESNLCNHLKKMFEEWKKDFKDWKA